MWPFLILCALGAALAIPPVMPPACSSGLKDACVSDCDCVWCPVTGCFSAPDRKEDLPLALKNVCGSRDAIHKTHAYSPHCRRWHAVEDAALVGILGFLVVWTCFAAPLICLVGCWCHYRERRQEGFRAVSPHENL